LSNKSGGGSFRIGPMIISFFKETEGDG